MAFFLSGWLRRLRVLRAQRRMEREMDEEMRFHVAMEAEELRRVSGLSPGEAHRQAMIAFGGVDRHKEAGREARGVAWLSSMSLDFKLGLRMLRKHPALTVVGGLGMAVAIAIATGFFTYSTAFYYSHPPLVEGDRVVAVENRNLQNSEDWRATLFDLHTWRDELRSVQELSAFRRRWRNLYASGGVSARVQVAEMTASGFRLARVAPLLGRPLHDTDELQGARPVIVIGHREWQRDFGGDRAILGRQVRLGSTIYEVVGVMPEGFRFPLNHGFWTALPTTRSLYGPGQGPKIFVFGRLAAGAGKRSAEAELATIGARLTAAFPAVYEHLRPTILPYVHVLLDVQQYPAWLIWLAQLVVSLLLTVVAVNVAVLVYARTASRRGEMTVRTALGAGRSRIVGQLFLEALVLSLLAAALGLLIAQVGYRELARLVSLETLLPYWIGGGLSPATVLYVVGLAVLAAFIVGVLPALQATGRELQSSLRHLGGGTDMRMGKTWTALIVVQVAIAVAVLPSVVAVASKNIRRSQAEPTFPVEELLSLRLQREADDAARPDLEASFSSRQAELIRRLETEPGVAGVTFAVPSAESRAAIETDRPLITDKRVYSRVRVVDVRYFDVFGVPLLTGRQFAPGDVVDGATTVIVNRAFVQRFLGGGDALGRRVRTLTGVSGSADSATSYEIVGVVEDMYADRDRPAYSEPVLYHASAAGSESLSIAVRTRGTTPAQLAMRVRTIAGEVAPDWQLTVTRMATLDGRKDANTSRFVALMVGLITVSVLLLSAAGVSALMSFSVTRRRREIGIRIALGASHARLVASIFARSIRQLAMGLIAGVAVAGALDRLSGGEMLGGRAGILLPLVATLMVLAGLLATMRPARRALRVHPMETLREE